MRTTYWQASFFTLLFISFSTYLQGASLLISNPSFETPATGPNSFIASDTAAPSGWSIYGPLQSGYRFFGVVNPNGSTLYADPVPQGNNVGVVFLLTPAGIEGGLQQTLTDTLQLNTQYTLTVKVGNMANDASPQNNFNFTGFPGYRVELLAGGTVIASDNNTLSPAEGRFLTSTVALATSASHAQAGQALGIRLINLNGTGIEVNFDDVKLDAVAVPEPSTVALAAGGSLILFRRLCKRRQDFSQNSAET